MGAEMQIQIKQFELPARYFWFIRVCDFMKVIFDLSEIYPCFCEILPFIRARNL